MDPWVRTSDARSDRICFLRQVRQMAAANPRTVPYWLTLEGIARRRLVYDLDESGVGYNIYNIILYYIL